MKKENKFRTWLYALAGIVILTVIDQYTKVLAVRYLKDQPDIPVIKDIFELSYVENKGAAFGMMQNQQIFFIVMTLVVTAVLLWIFHNLPAGKRFLPGRVTIVFLVAGAVGNLIDRMSQGFVVDFLYFKLIDFPVFNVADIYVTCSVAALAFLLLYYYKDEEIDMFIKVGK